MNNTDCATCNQPHQSYVREMPDGSSHVFQSAEELARRNAATLAFKINANKLIGVESPNMSARLAELTN